MTNSNKFSGKMRLLATAAPFAMMLAASPAFAQDKPAADDTSKDIVVTGSITRNPAGATASPIVSVTSADLSNRGISTVSDALQLLTANNAGTAPPSWSAFGFATGASAPSLRGLNDAYTLTLFNGLRSAPYPLGDDGYRNFVDTNTVPISIVDRIDTLLDGASATYGSDAIAGVINIIPKRQVIGVHLNASAGISEKGDAGERKFSATVGYGELDKQGFNIYVNGEYAKDDPLFLGQRGGLPSTADQSSVCGTAAQGCLFNGDRNGIQYDGTYNGFASTTTPFVRPYSAAGASLDTHWALLNPSAGCGNLGSATITAANLANLPAATRISVANSLPANGTVCQQDLVKQYRQYYADIERKGANLRATAKIGEDAEAWLMLNYYNTTTDNFTSPTGYTGATAAGGITSTVSVILLPAYVCSAGTGVIGTLGAGVLSATGCSAANGTLNPNNPYAAAGNLARLTALPIIPRETMTNNKVYRVSAGISGTFAGTWNYSLQGTASKSTLDITDKGYINLQGLLDAVAKGTYNFVDPTKNTAAQTQGVFPDDHTHSVSKLTQVIATLNKDVFALPGGAFNVAVTGQYRYEAIHNPSANAPNNAAPNSRYYSINAVAVDGSRHVWSAGYEITAPILDILKLKADGSYDSYSTHQSHFSPKFEAEFTPIKELKFRGTYSGGFRIPSFAESFALPTTGFVSSNITCTLASGAPNPTYASFCAAHATNPSYYSGGYSYGLTSSGNASLKPETSKSLTAGIVFKPTPSITFTADFWRTKIDHVIVGVTVTQAMINEYYTTGAITAAGVGFTKGVADPQNTAALPLLGTVTGSYKNADSYLAKGIDFSATASIPLTSSGLTWKTEANASWLLRLQQTNDDGTISRYDGSLGACNITSCSGAPTWRVTWQNTLDFNHKGNISLTAYYTSGYSEVATDSGGVYGDCQTSVDNGQILGWNDGSPVQCEAPATWNLDAHGEIKVQDHFTMYLDVQNILGLSAPYEPNAAYSLYQFNPAWADRNYIGRYFRVGAKVDF